MHLNLGPDLALKECIDAWVKGTSENRALAHSYLSSPDHIVFEFRHPSYGYEQHCCVFKKTNFVTARLAALAQKTARETEEAGQLAQKTREMQEEQRTLADLEMLRKSRFEAFVYLMEDSRNGAFKIGRSKTPGKRERTLQSEAPEITLRFYILDY
jgi:hypothetical protein